MNKTAIVIGVLGQDGSFMAELLFKNGYSVIGVVRENANQEKISWIKNILPSIAIKELNVLNKYELDNLIKNVNPEVIYNFAAVSNVFNPLKNLDEILLLNSKLPQNILESISDINRSIKYFQASSCLIFGNDKSGLQNENTIPNPIHPYGFSKLYSDYIVKEFRKIYNIYCCSGIFFNHESERRGGDFFTKKITNGIKDIMIGKRDKIIVGDLSSSRDYGYALDFMEASYMMMNNREPNDYVIGTGRLTSIEYFVKKCFDCVNLDFGKYILYDDNLNRKNDSQVLCADISKISKDLGWIPKYNVDDLINKMME